MKKKKFTFITAFCLFLLCGCNSSPQNPTILSKEAAQKIALQEIPGASTSNIKLFQLENDDGILLYEGTILYEEQKYEFEIDACDGTILEWNRETVYD